MAALQLSRQEADAYLGVARNIDDISTQLTAETKQLENVYAATRGKWEGPAADHYRAKLRLLIDDLNAIAQDMKDVSEIVQYALNNG